MTQGKPPTSAPQAVRKGLVDLIEKLGGIAYLVEAFATTGSAHKAATWVGKGEKIPPSADEVRRALGDEQIDRIADDAGMEPVATSDEMAGLIPYMVDRFSSQGRLVTIDEMKGALGILEMP